jgi:hypothetical protein
MKAAVLSGSPTRTAWNVHTIVLGVVALAAAALTTALWVHPTMGYAQGGFMSGMDLRGSLTQILWIQFGVFAAVSTLGIAVGRRLTDRRLVPMLASYALAIGALFPAMIVIDKFI